MKEKFIREVSILMIADSKGNVTNGDHKVMKGHFLFNP